MYRMEYVKDGSICILRVFAFPMLDDQTDNTAEMHSNFGVQGCYFKTAYSCYSIKPKY